MALFGKNRSTQDSGTEPGFIKVIDGVTKVLSFGKKQNTDDPYDYNSEPASDKETFLRFLAEYVKEIRKGD